MKILIFKTPTRKILPKIILSLTNNQTESPSHKKNVSIGKKKEKGDKNRINNIKSQNNNNLYNIDEDDIKKIKLISIDPDNFWQLLIIVLIFTF